MPAVARTLYCTELAVLVLLAGCEPPEPRSFPVTLIATDADGMPVAGVGVWASGASLGQTDHQGRLDASVRGHHGEVRRIVGTCPSGYNGADGPRRLVLNAGPGGEDEKPAAVRLELHCHATVHHVVIVVRASLDDGRALEAVTVDIDGEGVGQTDVDGSEHILLKRSSGSHITVSLDASVHPHIQTPLHVRSFLLGDVDTVLLLERSFTLKATRPKRRRSKRAPVARAVTTKRPFRIR